MNHFYDVINYDVMSSHHDHLFMESSNIPWSDLPSSLLSLTLHLLHPTRDFPTKSQNIVFDKNKLVNKLGNGLWCPLRYVGFG